MKSRSTISVDLLKENSPSSDKFYVFKINSRSETPMIIGVQKEIHPENDGSNCTVDDRATEETGHEVVIEKVQNPG